jgi:hypothetical protein
MYVCLFTKCRIITNPVCMTILRFVNKQKDILKDLEPLVATIHEEMRSEVLIVMDSRLKCSYYMGP